MRRDVLHIRLYTAAECREQQYFVLVYITLVVVWAASLIHRSMSKAMRRAALLAAILLLGWIIVRLVKWQFIFASVGNRYLWYSYYLFQLSLPLVLLWLSWIVDKPGDAIVFPKWMWAPVFINAGVCLLTLTNEFHFLVFTLDGITPNGSTEYGYGVGFYLMTAGWVVPLLVSVIMLMAKSGGMIRKTGLIFPVTFFVLLALYGYGYFNRIPIAWESDITMVIGVFSLLFTEAVIRTGMIPVNTKYSGIFAHSPLGMRLIDDKGQPALSSASAVEFDGYTLTRAIEASPSPIRKGEDSLVYAAGITGGYALWQKDISDLNRLHMEIEESIRKLKTANSVLESKERIKRAIDEEHARTELMTQLEEEISGHIAELSTMIEQAENSADKPKETTKITLLLCYIKRRCNLFFREKEADVLPADELTVYLDELAEIAGYSDVKVFLSSELKADISVVCPVRVVSVGGGGYLFLQAPKSPMVF